MLNLDMLSLVILNYNCMDDTIKCAKIINDFALDIHIIIVDNQSTDQSYTVLKDKFKEEENIDVLQSDRNGGYGYGNNWGIKYAENKYHSEFVGIINPDVIIEKGQVLEEMCAALKRDKKLAVVGASVLTPDRVYNANNSGWKIPTGMQLVKYHFALNNRYDLNNHWHVDENGIAAVECVVGCFFIAKLEVLKELGYFDENMFMYHEENLLGMKCKKQGYKVGICLGQFYIHNHVYKPGALPSKILGETKKTYKSAKYLCENYYSKKYIPLLCMAEILNHIYFNSIYYIKKCINRIFGWKLHGEQK